MAHPWHVIVDELNSDDNTSNTHNSAKSWDICVFFSPALIGRKRSVRLPNMSFLGSETAPESCGKVGWVFIFWPILATRNRLTICNFGRPEARKRKFGRHIHKSRKTCCAKFGTDRMYSVWVMVCQSCTCVLVLFHMGLYIGGTLCAPTSGLFSEKRFYSPTLRCRIMVSFPF